MTKCDTFSITALAFFGVKPALKTCGRRGCVAAFFRRTDHARHMAPTRPTSLDFEDYDLLVAAAEIYGAA